MLWSLNMPKHNLVTLSIKIAILNQAKVVYLRPEHRKYSSTLRYPFLRCSK